MARRGHPLSASILAGADSGLLPLDTDLLGLTSLGGGESSSGPYTGIKALMLAVLDNGISSYLSSVPRIRAEAEHWVNSKRQRSPFSFSIVCETLGLEPDAVRAELHRWRDSGVSPARAIARRRPNARGANRGLTRETG
jgi:hypothetical protein